MASTFNSQMLQNPSPNEDAYFKKEWFRWYHTTPKHLSKYCASDFAVTAKGGDFTVHAVVGVDPDDNLYILDIRRKQATTDIWIDQMIASCRSTGPSICGRRPRIRSSARGAVSTKRMAEARTYAAIRELSEAGDKPTKARSFQGRWPPARSTSPSRPNGSTIPRLGDVDVPGRARRSDRLLSLGRTYVGRVW